MGNKLEQLLNSLIKQGWKPFDVNDDWTNVEVINRINDNWYIPEHSKIIFKTKTHWHVFDCNIRDLVSKSSGLWQFVCENMLINKKWFYGDEYCIAEHCEYTPKYYKFRLIESSLKDESELEDFLLSNIKVDG